MRMLPQHQHRWLLITMTVLVVSGAAALAKSTAGKLPKKFIPVVHERPATGPKSLLDRFPAVGRLSADDVGFLKALDRQFVKYGNVKIKVENATAATSNGAGKKRTINNELGYGYYGQQQHAESTYSFSQPQIQIYPYSQHDIPPLPGYQQQQQQQHQQQQHYAIQQNQHSQQYAERVIPNSIQIEPSLSFELKSTPHGYQSIGEPQQHQHYQQQQQPGDVPVIVLRIPGPHKYAAHLQLLLQQYLELRAAEYISAVQQQEQHQQQQHHYQQQQTQQPEAHAERQHQQQQQHQYYGQSTYQQPQFVSEQQHHHQQVQAPQAHAQTVDYAEDTYQPTATDQEHYQHQQQSQYGVPVTTGVDASHLPIQENYPSRLHTRVIYTGHGSHTGASYSGDYKSHRTQVQNTDYYDEEEGAGEQQQHHQQQQRPYIYAYQQQHPQQEQEPEHDGELHNQQQLQHASEPEEEQSAVDDGAQHQQHHYHQQEQMAQLSAGYEQPSDNSGHQLQHEPEQQQQQQYAAVDPNLVSITHRTPAAAADQGEHTHSPYDRPYNYHAHGAGNEHQHQADDVREHAASRY